MADSNDKGSLADQLAGLSISVKESDEGSTEEATTAPAPPAPEPTDEELFAQVMEELSDEQLSEEFSRKKPKPEAKPEKNRGRGTLGEAFGDALADVSPVDSKLRRPREPEPPRTRRTPATSATIPDSDKPMSDEEIFAAAVESLSPDEVYRGKYFGKTTLPEAAQGPSISDYSENENEADDEVATEQPDESQARERVKDLQNQRMLEKVLGGIDKKVDSSKYRVKSPKPRPYSSEPNHDLNTEPLPKTGDGLTEVELQGSHKELLKRYQRRRRDQHIPELNVRGDVLEDALRQLELFTHKCWKDDTGFMRIIHGKGNQSAGDPVLKPAILKWLEGPGFRYVRGYAPEVDRGGNYGTVVVELTKLTRP